MRSIEIGEFTQNLWLTSTSQHINYNKNFELLEKGEHTFTYHSEVELDPEHLKFFFLNKK